MTKPSLLLISAIPPFPMDSGGANRIYHTIKELSMYYNLFLLTFTKPDQQFTSPQITFLKETTKEFHTVPLVKKSLTSSLPYRFSDWDNSKIKTIIKQLIKVNHIDKAQIEFTQLLYLVNDLPSNIQKIFTAHDISSVSFWRRIPESSDFTKKIASFFFWLQIYFYGKKYLSRFDQINTVSETDSLYLQKYFGLKSKVIPNGIDKINFINKKPGKIIKLGYIGSFSHPPNRYAIDYFTNNIAPLLDKHGVKYQFYLAGNNPEYSHPKVINLGIVANIKDFYNQIDILVAPIFSGSGTRIKILESLSFGIPVITTPIGAEGINIKSDYLQLATNPMDFLQKIINCHPVQKKELTNQLNKYLWSKLLADNT